MNVQGFIEDSPLGLGWLMGGIALSDAIGALVEESGLSRDQIIRKYSIPLKDLYAG